MILLNLFAMGGMRLIVLMFVSIEKCYEEVHFQDEKLNFLKSVNGRVNGRFTELRVWFTSHETFRMKSELPEKFEDEQWTFFFFEIQPLIIMISVRLFIYGICMANICFLVGCYRAHTLNGQIDTNAIAFALLGQLSSVLCYSRLIYLWYLS